MQGPSVAHADDVHDNKPTTTPQTGERRVKFRSLLALVAKIKILRDSGLTARYPKGIPNRLVAVLKDGTQITCENEFPRGHDQNPMTDAEVTEKFERMTAKILDQSARTKVLDTCWKLDSLSHISDLFKFFPKA